MSIEEATGECRERPGEGDAVVTLPGSPLLRAAIAGGSLVLLGGAFSAMTTGALAFIGDVFPTVREGEMMGLRPTATGVGGVLGPRPIGGVATYTGYELAFALASGLVSRPPCWPGGITDGRRRLTGDRRNTQASFARFRTVSSLAAVSRLELGYAGLFALATLVCVASVPGARRIEDADTRRGLVALLLTSGGWALAHVGLLLAPTLAVGYSFHVAGLVVGLATVGPWLYFCSAYTGRTLHRVPAYRRVLLGIFLAIVLLKVTNPIHGWYFTATVAATPFPHVAIRPGPLHWIVAGLAYVLVGVGFFTLLELFEQTGHDTRPLLGLLLLMGAPVVLNLVGDFTPYLLDMDYEPLGVAAFAVGALFVFADRFRLARISGDLEDPLIVLGEEGDIRYFNDAARDLFPALAEAVGESIETLPRLGNAIEREERDGEERVFEIERDGDVRYYLVSTNPFGGGRTGVGRVVLLNDVTESERYRRELERKNERLERFASVVSHDLRNPLNVAKGHLDIVQNRHDDENLAEIATSLDRMEEIIEDVLALARQGEDIDETRRVSLAVLLERALESVDAEGADVAVEDDLTFRGDPERVRQLVENLLRNAIEHAGPDVAVRVGALEDGDGFYVEDDGPGVPAEDRDEVFDEGYTTSEEGSGLGLSIVAEIATAHGWDVSIVESDRGGVRFEFTGVEVVE